VNQSLIVLLVGIAVIASGVIAWLVRKDQGSAQNKVKLPLGFEFELNTPAFAIIALGIGIIVVSTFIPNAAKSPDVAQDAKSTDVVDPALDGVWEGSTRYSNVQLDLHFGFSRSGTFSRKYTHDEQGALETAGGQTRFIGSEVIVFPVALHNDGVNVLTALTNGSTFRYTRKGGAIAGNNPLLGAWETDIAIGGASFHFLLDIDSARSFRLHAEAFDEGPCSAANGEWRMISNWSTQPVQGAYKVQPPASLSLDLFPFNWVQLHKIS